MSTAMLIQRPFTYAFNTGRIILVGVFALMLVAALHPDVRSAVRGSVMKDYRMVVSTAHGDLLGNGVDLTVAKVRTRDALLIEIYEPKTNGGVKLIGRIELPDKKDGFFNFNGNATNLAIDDIQGDGRLEILAPSFDQNMVGHLNIYHYDQGIGTFARTLR
jgi:hypothetical protein